LDKLRAPIDVSKFNLELPKLNLSSSDFGAFVAPDLLNYLPTRATNRTAMGHQELGAKLHTCDLRHAPMARQSQHAYPRDPDNSRRRDCGDNYRLAVDDD
jgi:hypothetical protein